MPTRPPFSADFTSRYEIIRPLAEGGMGRVYLARHRELSRLVAVKVLRVDLDEAWTASERLLEEARLMSQLRSPHIVSVYDCGREGDSPYLVFEYIEGETLADAIDLRGAMPWEDALTIGHQVLEALSVAHGQGIIHRDLKPANIILRAPDRRAMVMDFGMAKALDRQAFKTGDGTILGTPGYLAPEMIGEGVVSIQTDLYALGCTLWEALAGRLPFGGDRPAAILRAHLSGVHPSLAKEKPAVPAVVARAVERAIQRDPRARYGSAREMGKVLGEAAHAARSGISASGLSGASGKATRVARTIPAGAAAVADADKTSAAGIRAAVGESVAASRSGEAKARDTAALEKGQARRRRSRAHRMRRQRMGLVRAALAAATLSVVLGLLILRARPGTRESDGLPAVSEGPQATTASAAGTADPGAATSSPQDRQELLLERLAGEAKQIDVPGIIAGLSRSPPAHGSSLAPFPSAIPTGSALAKKVRSAVRSVRFWNDLTILRDARPPLLGNVSIPNSIRLGAYEALRSLLPLDLFCRSHNAQPALDVAPLLAPTVSVTDTLGHPADSNRADPREAALFEDVRCFTPENYQGDSDASVEAMDTAFAPTRDKLERVKMMMENMPLGEGAAAKAERLTPPERAQVDALGFLWFFVYALKDQHALSAQDAQKIMESTPAALNAQSCRLTLPGDAWGRPITLILWVRSLREDYYFDVSFTRDGRTPPLRLSLYSTHEDSGDADIKTWKSSRHLLEISARIALGLLRAGRYDVTVTFSHVPGVAARDLGGLLPERPSFLVRSVARW